MSCDEPTGAHTLCFDPQPLPEFSLDEAKIHEEVGEIVEGDYFRLLQAKAKSLRAQRSI